jgi:DNA-binding FadR family transcriptional regulator
MDDRRALSDDRLALSGSRVSRAEALARHLETEITVQALPAGERLGTKSELRERFGVAAGTLNEAVRLMEMRGLIAARPGPGGGVFVASVSDRARLSNTILGLDWGHATLRDCLEVRTALEPLICQRATLDRTAEDIAALHAIVDEMEARTADTGAYLKANWTFHRRVAGICRNAPLRSVYVTLLDFLEAGLADFDFEELDSQSIVIHRNIVNAIDKGDVAETYIAFQHHLSHSPLPSGRPAASPVPDRTLDAASTV